MQIIRTSVRFEYWIWGFEYGSHICYHCANKIINRLCYEYILKHLMKFDASLWICHCNFIYHFYKIIMISKIIKIWDIWHTTSNNFKLNKACTKKAKYNIFVLFFLIHILYMETTQTPNQMFRQIRESYPRPQIPISAQRSPVSRWRGGGAGGRAAAAGPSARVAGPGPCCCCTSPRSRTGRTRSSCSPTSSPSTPSSGSTAPGNVTLYSYSKNIYIL